MNVNQLLFLLIVQFLPLIWARAYPPVKSTTPYRTVFFNYQNNAVCLYANDTAHTHFEIEFDNARLNESIPVMIFNYRDLPKFKNLPNFNSFLNHTYLNEPDEMQRLITIDEETKQVDFNFQLVSKSGQSLPESVWYKVITNETLIRYDVKQPGTYCIYMPLYTLDWNTILPTNYQAQLTVEEFSPVSVFHDISVSVNIAIMFGSILVGLSYLYPAIRARKFTKLPPVIQQLTQLLIVYVGFTMIQLALRLIYLFVPNDFIYTFTEDYFGYFANILLNKWQKFIISQVYFGLGYVNCPNTILKYIFQVAFIINLVSVVIVDNCVNFPIPITGVSINNEHYSIFKKSILVNEFYANIVINQNSDLLKYIFNYGTQAQIICGFVMQVSRFVSGVYFAWKLRKFPKLAKPMISTVLLHLIAWTSFGKQSVYVAFVRLNFSGVFDVGELLGQVGKLMETYEVKWLALSLVEILLLWFIWSTGKPYDYSVAVKQDEEKKKKKKNKDETVKEKKASDAKGKEKEKQKGKPKDKKKAADEKKPKREKDTAKH
ncbi:hypothetical protein CANMA_001767 [Candida margitis]|uniref:uncharacterized protein n=1 Tax=Candida margitis TaxID=1775924 RepID=UPI002226A80E|nr:uncharacterized protein CANMA_001767 [Candida margitis]KAI5969214.1 hypothetical protein CANMA_001767 [Candida margitis]